MSTNYYRYANALPLLNYYILAALANRPLYAYALGEQVQHDSAGAVVPARASLRNALQRLESWGYITVDLAGDYQDSRRGASYVLTATGRNRLKQEIAYLERALRTGARNIKQYELQHPSPEPT